MRPFEKGPMREKKEMEVNVRHEYNLEIKCVCV